MALKTEKYVIWHNYPTAIMITAKSIYICIYFSVNMTKISKYRTTLKRNETINYVGIMNILIFLFQTFKVMWLFYLWHENVFLKHKTNLISIFKKYIGGKGRTLWYNWWLLQGIWCSGFHSTGWINGYLKQHEEPSPSKLIEWAVSDLAWAALKVHVLFLEKYRVRLVRLPEGHSKVPSRQSRPYHVS